MNALSLSKFQQCSVAVLISMALGIVFLIPARANLGDSVEQVVKRYGKPSGYAEASAKSPFGSLLYRAAGFELVLFVLKDVEVGARFSKGDKTAFTDEEVQEILQSDSGGSSWTSVSSSDPTCLQWERADKATALYDKDKHMLIFTSDQMAQAVHSSDTSASGTNAK